MYGIVPVTQAADVCALAALPGMRPPPLRLGAGGRSPPAAVQYGARTAGQRPRRTVLGRASAGGGGYRSAAAGAVAVRAPCARPA